MAEETVPLVIRIDKDLKKAFELVAEDQDLTVSQMIRHHIRYVVEKHAKENAQKPLFKPVEPPKPKTEPKVSPKAKKPPMESKQGLLGMFKGKC